MPIHYIKNVSPSEAKPKGVKIINADSEDAPDLPTEPEKIGYGNPPKHMQFKKGKSGNPSGRPRKPPRPLPRTSQDYLLRALDQPAMVTVNGKRQKTVVLDAVVMHLVHRAMKGDPKAIRELIRLMDGKALPEPRENGEWTPSEIVDNFWRELKKTSVKKKGDDHGDE